MVYNTKFLITILGAGNIVKEWQVAATFCGECYVEFEEGASLPPQLTGCSMIKDKEEATEAEEGAEKPYDREKVVEELRKLAEDYSTRSDAGRLRDILDEVDAALAAGASYAAVLETLHAQGFKLTPASFETTLARLRKERREKEKKE